MPLHGVSQFKLARQIADGVLQSFAFRPAVAIAANHIPEAADLVPIDLYAQVADQIMIDAKAPKGAKLPGGNGVAFDWQLLAGKKYWQAPWMLAGGLTPENVAEAIRKTGARQVDVASGVETAPAQKDADLMRAFVEAAQAV